MFINGIKEWIGNDAHRFLIIRTTLEQSLLALGYDYFCGGIISKRSVYESHAQMLGANFAQILTDFSFKGDKYILSPEYTFRVYEYLNRTGCLNKGNKVFYSQEMVRNETSNDIQKGKTFSFWQIGYEIFGTEDRLLSIESMQTLFRCLQALPLEDLYFRISDNRILSSLCKQYAIEDKGKVLALLEDCNENGEAFYLRYVNAGGDPAFAGELRELLNLSADRKLTFSNLKNALREPAGLEAVNNLEAIHNALGSVLGQEAIVLTPLMTKTWEAYTTFICDARLADYDKAIAGGGNLFIDPANPHCLHSGAGIGVTRIAEYFIARGLSMEPA